MLFRSSLAPGDLFVAIRGVRTDGHQYVAKAFEAGAGAAVVDRPVENLAAAHPLIWVDDTLRALNGLARAARTRSRARIAAVTGSAGKTGTKEALALVLGRQPGVFASPASFNNHWGVPLSLAQLGRDVEFGIFEMGMNHGGEIEPLSRLARPHLALVTNVEAVHLGHFASVEAIADAKAEVFAGIEPGGIAVINRDSEHFARLAEAARARGAARIVGFGETEPADARLLACDLEAEASTVSAIISGRALSYRLNLAGRHWALNSLAVLAAVDALRGDVEAAAAALADWQVTEGRGRRYRVALAGGELTLIDESYNANPASVRAALAVLAASVPEGGGRRIAVLGDMLELGSEGPALHVGLAGAIEASGADLVFAVGPLMARLHDALPADRRGGQAEDAQSLVGLVVDALAPGDVVTVKGSYGMGMGVVVGAIRTLAGAPSRMVNGGQG